MLLTAATESEGGFGLGKFLSDPNLIGKLATNPRTQKHLADPSFVQKLRLIQQNPALADSLLSGDPRMIDVLGVAMGIDIQGFTREEGSDELPPGFQKAEPEPTSRPSASTSTPSSSSTPAPAPTQEAKVEDVEMEEPEEDDDAKAKAAALEEKTKGNAAYKARDFPAAAVHFEKAWDTWPKDITFLTNLGGERIIAMGRSQRVLTLISLKLCISSRASTTSALRRARRR